MEHTLSDTYTKLPKKVLVLGKWYSIETDDHLMDDESGSGICKPWQCQIRIGKGLNPQQRRDTLLHEVMHAVFSETGLTMDFKEDDDEEKIVRRLSTCLLQVIRENPEFTAILTEK